MRIIKYQLIEKTVVGITGMKAGESFEVEMIKGAKILTATKEESINQLLQQLQICATIWTEVDSNEVETELRTFTLLQANEDHYFATKGKKATYIASFQVAPMVQMQHLYELTPITIKAISV